MLGHSGDHRPDLPQVKIAMAVLDPLGLPLMTVVAGHTADDPLYLPEIAKVRQVARTAGLTYVGDCKMATPRHARGDRGAQDPHLCPLSAKQMPDAELDRGLDPVLRNVLEPSEIRLPPADGVCDETDDPVAMGFALRSSAQRPINPDSPRRGKSAVWSCARWPLPRAKRSTCATASHVPSPRSTRSMNASKANACRTKRPRPKLPPRSLRTIATRSWCKPA